TERGRLSGRTAEISAARDSGRPGGGVVIRFTTSEDTNVSGYVNHPSRSIADATPPGPSWAYMWSTTLARGDAKSIPESNRVRSFATQSTRSAADRGSVSRSNTVRDHSSRAYGAQSG